LTSRGLNEDDFRKVMDFLDEGVHLCLEAQKHTSKCVFLLVNNYSITTSCIPNNEK